MRIVSLLPAAVEMVYQLGLGKHLVGVSHDCNFPREVGGVPKITSSEISNTLSSYKIDQKVNEYKHRGQSVFHIDQELLKKLNPTLVITQELCPVCAPSFEEVQQACQVLSNPFKTLSLTPHTLNDIFENILTVGKFTGKEKVALNLVKNLKKRMETVKKKIHNSKSMIHNSVLVIEWLAPLMSAGHWVPEMIQAASGKPLGAQKGERSKYITWNTILRLNPDVIIIAPCGFDIKRTKKEISLITKNSEFKKLKAYKNKQVFLMDGDAYLTRPGPRVVDGIEILAKILYPNLFPRRNLLTDWYPFFAQSIY